MVATRNLCPILESKISLFQNLVKHTQIKFLKLLGSVLYFTLALVVVQLIPSLGLFIKNIAGTNDATWCQCYKKFYCPKL
jgi:hypothetical protein